MQMILGPRPGPISEADLTWAYAWPEPVRQAWVRAMMLFTLDGAVAGSDGRSGSISSELDRAVFDEVRRGCDAVLIGAGTFRAERYRPMVSPTDTAERRVGEGLAPAPRLVIVSKGLDLPWEEDVFTGSTQRPLVVTLAQDQDQDQDQGQARAQALDRAGQHAEVLALPGPDLDPGALLHALAEAGLHRVVCEGGPGLLATLSRAGLIDEAVISIAPTLAAGGQAKTGDALAAPRQLRPEQIIVTEDGFLFTRYRRAAAPTR